MAERSLLIVCMNYAPELTGCGKYTGEIGREMLSRGHDVAVVTTPPHYPGWRVAPGHSNGWSSEVSDGVRINRCPLVLREKMGGVWRLIAPATFALSAGPVILWRALVDRPAVILLIEPTLLVAPFVLLAAKLCGARTVLHVQDLEVDAAFAVGHLKSLGTLRSLAFRFERFCLRGFDRIVTIGKVMADRLAGKVADEVPISIVRNWVDLDSKGSDGARDAYRDELGLPRDAVVALYSGNIGPKQGLNVIVDAARLLRERSNIVFAIAGDGPGLAGLRESAAGLDNIRFLPFQPAERFSDFLAACDMHLLPQQATVASLVVPSKLGAMLVSGRPIIVTAEPDTEIAQFVRGVSQIVPPADPTALAGAVGRIADGGTADVSAAQAAMAECLSHHRAFEELEQILWAPSISPALDPRSA